MSICFVFCSKAVQNDCATWCPSSAAASRVPLGPKLEVLYRWHTMFRGHPQTPKQTTFSMFGLLVPWEMIWYLDSSWYLPFKFLGTREVWAGCFFNQWIVCIHIYIYIVESLGTKPLTIDYCLLFKWIELDQYEYVICLFLYSFAKNTMIPVLFRGIGSPSVSPASAASSHSASPSCASEHEAGSVGQFQYWFQISWMPVFAHATLLPINHLHASQHSNRSCNGSQKCELPSCVLRKAYPKEGSLEPSAVHSTANIQTW